MLATAVVAPILRRPTPRVALPDGAIRFGVHQATGAALVQCCHRGGVLVVAVLGSSATQTGHAALATGLALGATYAVLQAFTVTLTHVAAGDVDEAEAVLRRLAGVLVAAAGTAALVGAVVVDDVVPVVFGDEYSGAAGALGPAMALVVLAPLHSLLVQAAALRLRPEVASTSGALSLAAFAVAAVALVPTWGATGATTAALIAVAVGTATAVRLLPGAAGTRLVVVSSLLAALVAGTAALA